MVKNNILQETETSCDLGPGSLRRAMLIFQIGTNNWQRQGEFAPGSGILHASFHDARWEDDGKIWGVHDGMWLSGYPKKMVD